MSRDIDAISIPEIHQYTRDISILVDNVSIDS